MLKHHIGDAAIGRRLALARLDQRIRRLIRASPDKPACQSSRQVQFAAVRPDPPHSGNLALAKRERRHCRNSCSWSRAPRPWRPGAWSAAPLQSASPRSACRPGAHGSIDAGDRCAFLRGEGMHRRRRAPFVVLRPVRSGRGRSDSRPSSLLPRRWPSQQGRKTRRDTRPPPGEPMWPCSVSLAGKRKIPAIAPPPLRHQREEPTTPWPLIGMDEPSSPIRINAAVLGAAIRSRQRNSSTSPGSGSLSTGNSRPLRRPSAVVAAPTPRPSPAHRRPAISGSRAVEFPPHAAQQAEAIAANAFL